MLRILVPLNFQLVRLCKMAKSLFYDVILSLNDYLSVRGSKKVLQKPLGFKVFQTFNLPDGDTQDATSH